MMQINKHDCYKNDPIEYINKNMSIEEAIKHV